MQFETKREAIRLAVAERFGTEVALKLDAAWRQAVPSPDEGDNDTGRAIAIALSSLPAVIAAPQVDALGLYEVEMGNGLILSPLDAIRHPLLKDWTATTFADALAQCIASGRLAFMLSPATPIYNTFEMLECDGAITHARAVLQFDVRHGGQLRVILRFGAPVQSMFARAAWCAGDAVYGVGEVLQDPLIASIAACAAETAADAAASEDRGQVH